MRNPLNKRYLREMKGDFGKYAVIFLLLVLMISEVSGYLVAGDSMIRAYNEAFTKYNTEDGNFTTEKQMNRGQQKRVEALGVKLYELTFTEMELDGGQTIRVFADRTQVNKVCLMSGRMPEKTGEIALDRMFAENNQFGVGDVITAKGVPYTICGLVALPDYSTQFQDNNQMMFDALLFGVSIVTKEQFDLYTKDNLTWRYAWKYDAAYETREEQDALSETFLKGLTKEVTLTGYIPRYVNQAINFAGDDLQSDKAMMELLLYIVIAIIAFVFAVTISNTIVKEANVIGTLRASGYTKAEMIRHYMFLPIVVTLIAALIGNILGYTVMKGMNARLYYNSYSLTTYTTVWNGIAFLKTTLLPILIMLVVNYLILARRLSLSPLKFLRRDLNRRRGSRAIPLSKHLPFFSRFRVRIMLQNISNYVVLFIGIWFANLLLLFGLMFPNMLDTYDKTIREAMFCNYQYVLSLPAGAVDEENKLDAMFTMMRFENAVDTENPDAEKFSVYQLKTMPDEGIVEDEIMLYGVAENSRYLNVPLEGNAVVISSSYADKFNYVPGDTVTLKEEFGTDTYTFEITGIYPYEGSLCLFMTKEHLNEVFDLGKDTFAGYFSDTELTDIDESFVGQVIDLDAVTRISRQLRHSMGGMMYIVDVFSVIMFVILIYLLSKIIIEKNAQSISMTKILGYTNGEISRLYIMVTSILVVVFILLSLPAGYYAIGYLWRVLIMTQMTGWIPYRIGMEVFYKMVVIGIVTYAVVAVFEYVKIARVPMEEALKNVE